MTIPTTRNAETAFKFTFLIQRLNTHWSTPKVSFKKFFSKKMKHKTKWTKISRDTNTSEGGAERHRK